jgi:iron complex transport system substrate-binding protein
VKKRGLTRSREGRGGRGEEGEEQGLTRSREGREDGKRGEEGEGKNRGSREAAKDAKKGRGGGEGKNRGSREAAKDAKKGRGGKRRGKKQGLTRSREGREEGKRGEKRGEGKKRGSREAAKDAKTGKRGRRGRGGEEGLTRSREGREEGKRGRRGRGEEEGLTRSREGREEEKLGRTLGDRRRLRLPSARGSGAGVARWVVRRGHGREAGGPHAKPRSDAKKRRETWEELSAIVVDCAYHLHVDLGPGLLESVYEAVLARLLTERGLRVERQKPIAFEYQGIRFDDGLRVDLLVDNRLIVELKSVETLAPVHGKQLLTYLRLLQLPLGLLINFGAATFKEGCRRIVNNQP